MANCDHWKETSGLIFGLGSYYYCNVDNHTITDTYYCEDSNRSDQCPTLRERYGSHGCFITTVTCGILEKDDKNEVMQKLRSFRDNILQKDKKYETVLKMYDVIGPLVACNVNHDKDRDKKATELYSKLEKFTEMIDEGKYDEVANEYIGMTLRLIIQYKMKDLYRSLRDNNFGYKEGEFDQSTAGHGLKLINPDNKQ